MIRMSVLIIVLVAWSFGPDAPSGPGTPVAESSSVAEIADGSSAAQQVAAAVVPGVQIDGPASAEEQARVDEAVALFDAVGLELPSTLVRFGSEGECKEHMGLFSATESQTVISICSDLEFVLTHELAHVWIHENIDDAAKQAYIEARGLPTWRSRSFEWGDRGVEDAAFVMQQVLMFGEDRSTSDSWQERVAAFQLLTIELV